MRYAGLSDERKIQSYLSINERGKGIPYGGCKREDGNINHGFSPLKRNQYSIDNIPEANDDMALKSALHKMNDEKTGIFTIGCVSSPVSDTNGHRISGYIEFAFNYVELVADAQNYFPLFFHFNKWLKNHGMIDDVKFDWELEGAHFFEKNCDGLTCSVIVNIRYCECEEKAQELWKSAICILSDYLETIPIQPCTKIY